MFSNLVRAIRCRTREQWHQHVYDRFTELRIWTQEHGEKAAVVSLLFGIFLVLAFKLFVFLLVLAILAGYTIWFVALPTQKNEETMAVPLESSNISDSEQPDQTP